MGMLLPGRALVVSLGLHLALGYGAFERAGAPKQQPASPAPDVWAGNAVEVESVTLRDSEPQPRTPAEASETSSPPAEDREPEREPKAAPGAPAEIPEATAPRAPKRRAVEAEADATPRPARSGNERSPASARSSAAASPAAVPAGSFGAPGLPQGMRSLPKAFARALPQASKADGGWHDLELGRLPAFEVQISVDEQGKLAELTRPGKTGTLEPAVLRRMLDRTLLLLRSGTFSLSENARQSGTQRLKLEVEVSEVAPSEDEFAEARHVRQHGRVPGHETPSLERPARCFWIYNSGRRVDVRIWLAPSGIAKGAAR